MFSFLQFKPVKFFQYEVPVGAPGGDSDQVSASRPRFPRLTQSIWHPTGTFILTAHEDSSFVVWDPRDGRKILARTLQTNHVDKFSTPFEDLAGASGTFAVKEPIFRVAWCCKENPDETGLLFAGGGLTTAPTKGLSFLELGHTPNYATSSWQVLTSHFEKPTKQTQLVTPPKTEVVDFCLIPRSSPHHAGAQDPIATIALLSSGELMTMSFPSGHPISPTNQLSVNLFFVSPFLKQLSMAYIDRTQWLGMKEKRYGGPPILKGGAEASRSLRKFAHRNIMLTAHNDGVIRAWDAGHGDEFENGAAVQIDVAQAIARDIDVSITTVSMSNATGELAAGLATGELVIFRWGNHHAAREPAPLPRNDDAYTLFPIHQRAETSLKEGLLPLTMFSPRQGTVTACKTSDVGFIAAGFQSGSLAVIDLRGPAVIYNASLEDFTQKSKRSSIRKSNSQNQRAQPEWPTWIEFGVMSLDEEEFSSILLFVGTNIGRVITFKILPRSTGGYEVQYAGSSSAEESISYIYPMNAENGGPAEASQSAVANLKNGLRVSGVLVVVTRSSARIFRPTSSKGASKSWDDVFCDKCAVVRFDAHGYALIGLFGDGTAKAFSLPGLKEIASRSIANVLDVRRLSEAIITPTGDIFAWKGPSELAVLNVWGTGQEMKRSMDKMFNPEIIPPPRPTISNLQWLSSGTYMSPADLDKLIGGPNRPPSTRQLAQQKPEAQPLTNRPKPSTNPSSSSLDEGYWSYMQRTVQERTQTLGLTGDKFEELQDNSSGLAEDVNKFISNTKKNIVLGGLKSKFGF